MKLYSVNHSPYSARARMAVYAAKLPMDIVHPPGNGGDSPQWLAINSLGRIPALQLDDGTIIPESDTIVEYLADAFPERGLRPASAVDRARARLLGRIVDLYLYPAGEALISQMDPGSRDHALVDSTFAGISAQLRDLETFMSHDRYAVGDSLSTADFALVPNLFYLAVFGKVFGRGDFLASFPKIAGYWTRIQEDEIAREVIREMQDALTRSG